MRLMLTTNRLVIFYYGTFVPSANGSHFRITSMLDRLAPEFSNITVYSYENHPNCPWTPASEAAFRERWPGIELVIERFSSVLHFVTRVKNLLVSLFPSAAQQILSRSVPGATPKLRALQDESNCFIVSYAEGLAQLNGIDSSRCFVETHDVNFLKWSKLHHKSPISLVPLRKLRGELGVLEAVHYAISISPAETSFFKMMLNTPMVAYVPSWEPPRSQADGDQGPYEFDFVFAGSEYVMNVRGLVSLLKDHGQWLSNYRIAVCGKVCDDPAVIAAVAPFSNVKLLGFVDSVEDIYARSKAALAPVDGTGLKIKVASALAAGLPVFASEHCLEGLPEGHEGAVFEINEARAREILENDNRLKAAKSAASRYDARLKEAGDLPQLLTSLHSFFH
jgi:glycosyltransferase involved in cell wall biosynthesis